MDEKLKSSDNNRRFRSIYTFVFSQGIFDKKDTTNFQVQRRHHGAFEPSDENRSICEIISRLFLFVHSFSWHGIYRSKIICFPREAKYRDEKGGSVSRVILSSFYRRENAIFTHACHDIVSKYAEFSFSIAFSHARVSLRFVSSPFHRVFEKEKYKKTL